MCLSLEDKGSDNEVIAKAGLFCYIHDSTSARVCFAKVVAKLASGPSVSNKWERYQIPRQGWSTEICRSPSTLKVFSV